MNRLAGEPVLLVAFNRPDSLHRVIDATRPHRPPRVYLAVDGPRPGLDDQAAVAACRELAGAVDWGAEVHTLFRDENLGCGLGPARAIDWFLEREARGVILEDDVVPTEDFFPFMHQMLETYSDTSRVLTVAGSSFVPQRHLSPSASFRFSRYPYVWGWGTWRRSWSHYRFELGDWRRDLPEPLLWERTGHSLRATLYFRSRFDAVSKAGLDAWDYQLAYTAMSLGALTVTPNHNLTLNIGFDGRATHTRRKPRFDLSTSRAPLAVVAPQSMLPDHRADTWTVKHQFGATAPRAIYRGLQSSPWWPRG